MSIQDSSQRKACGQLKFLLTMDKSLLCVTSIEISRQAFKKQQMFKKSLFPLPMTFHDCVITKCFYINFLYFCYLFEYRPIARRGTDGC